MKTLYRLFGNSADAEEILKKSFFSLFFRVTNYGLGFVYIWTIARYFSLEEQGAFSITLTLLLFLVMFCELGVQTAMVKWLSGYFEKEDFALVKTTFFYIFKRVSILSFFISIIIFFNGNLIAELLFSKPQLKIPIKIISVTIPFFTTTELVANYFRSKKNIAVYSFYIFAGKFIFPLFTFWILLFGLDYYDEKYLPIKAYAIGIIVTGIFSFIHLNYDLKNVHKSINPQLNLNEILKTSLPLFFSSSIVMFMWWGDTFILGKFKNEEDVGIYSIAVKLGTVVSFFYSAIVSILLPKLAVYFSSNKKDELINMLQYTSKIIFITTVPTCIILGVFSEFFLSIFGEEYLEGKNILLIILLAQVVNAFTGPVGPFLSMCGEEKKQLYLIIFALIINLIISLSLVFSKGGVGVAIGSATGMILWNLLGAIFIKKKYGFKTWISF